MNDVILHLGDCLEFMKGLGTTSTGIVITDPPYGISENSSRRLHAYKDPSKSKGRIGWDGMAATTDYGDTRWDDKPLNESQWQEILRISKHQIVFGANHLHDVLGKPPSVIVWDKKCQNDWDDFFSDCELIWCSRIQPDKVYRQLWMGALRGGKRVERVHPTQKPVELMEWLIRRYSNEGDTIIDPFMGSGSTGVAAVNLGRNFIGCEIHSPYFETAKRRIAEAQAQMPLAMPEQKTKRVIKAARKNSVRLFE